MKIRPTVPRSLTLVRHGESEGNRVRRLFEDGTPHPNEHQLMGVHTCNRRLTPKGVLQAQTAGAWLTKHWLPQIEYEKRDARLYYSPYVRAMETAGHFGFGQYWRPDNRIMERDWGELDALTYEERMKRYADILDDPEDDAFFWRPPGGEAIFNVFLRLRDMMATLLRECSDMHVLVVCHGETMSAWRHLIEYWTPQRFALEMQNKSNATRNINCRIIQYLRFTDSGVDTEKYQRVRFINPEKPNDPEWNTDWTGFSRPMYSYSDLLAQADEYSRFLDVA